MLCRQEILSLIHSIFGPLTPPIYASCINMHKLQSLVLKSYTILEHSNRANYRRNRMRNCRHHQGLLPARYNFSPRKNRHRVSFIRWWRDRAHLLERVNKSVMDIVGNVNSQIHVHECTSMWDMITPYSFVKHNIRTVIHKRKEGDL